MDQRQGINRRDLIKASLVAGGAAWVAPAIIDSFASPAAAVSLAPGCYEYVFLLTASGATCTTTLVDATNNGGSNCGRFTPPNPSGCTSVTGVVPASANAAAVTAAGCTAVAGALTGWPTFSIAGGYDTCNFASYATSATCTSSALTYNPVSGKSFKPAGSPSSASVYVIVVTKC